MMNLNVFLVTIFHVCKLMMCLSRTKGMDQLLIPLYIVEITILVYIILPLAKVKPVWHTIDLGSGYITGIELHVSLVGFIF